MTDKIFNYLGFRNEKGLNPVPKNLETPIRALPAPWYTLGNMYELERRAIFSRRWLLMTHKSRFQESGDFLRYTVAGYDFIIVLDRTHKINAFHNVCRHRAYPVIEPRQGRANIFACRYHGWSYGLNGKLAKAPNYRELSGFDEKSNGLFKIHVHVDLNGFIYVNMDSKQEPEVSWEDHFKSVDKQNRFEQFNFDDYTLDHTYELEGDYNWKLAADNFNECYHCKTTHPDVPAFLNIDSHDVETVDGHMQHDHAPSAAQKAKGYDVNSTYYFPNASMSVAPHFLMIQKFMPNGPLKSIISYEIFRNKNSSERDFRLVADTYARVMAEDKVLCQRAQKNINVGVFVNGELHPRWEKGPLFFQQTVRELITEHFRREQTEGAEIWPARQQLPDDAFVSEMDLEVCKGLACRAHAEKLVW